MATEGKNNQSITTNEHQPKGELTFDNKVIEKIVSYAVEEVPGLLGANGGVMTNIKNKLVNTNSSTDGIDVEVGKEQVAVDLNIVMEYGHNARNIYKELTQVLARHISETTNLKLVELNVEVIDIQTQQEYESSQTSLQDRIKDAGSTIKDKTSDGVNSVKRNASQKMSSDESRVR